MLNFILSLFGFGRKVTTTITSEVVRFDGRRSAGTWDGEHFDSGN